MILECISASKLKSTIILKAIYLLLFYCAFIANSQIVTDSTTNALQGQQIEKIFEPNPSTIINLIDLNDQIKNSKTQSDQIQNFMSIKHSTLNIIYVASLSGGLFVLDLSDQSILQQFPMNCKKVFIRSNRLYTSRGKEGYTIFQIDNQTGQLSQICDATIGSSVDSLYVSEDGINIYLGSEGYIFFVKVNNKGTSAFDYEVKTHVGIYSGESSFIYYVSKNYLMAANLSNGVSVINMSNSIKPYLVTQKLSKWQVVDICIVSNGKVVYAIEEWYGLYIGDFSLLYSNEGQFKSSDKTWQFHIDFHTICRAISVSSDEKQLFIGLRSIGVMIYDISIDKFKPILINKVQMDGLANHIFLFNSNNSFLYSNGCCVAIFNLVEANYNIDIPNIFNTHISNAYEYWSENTWPWEYVYSNSSNQLYLASALQGVQVFELQKSPFMAPKKIFENNSFPKSSTDTVALIEEKNLLVQGCSDEGLIFWNVTNLQQITKSGNFSHKFENDDSDGIIYNKKLDCLVVANGYQGVYLLEIKDIKNTKVLSKINIIDYDLIATVETVQMTIDAQYLIMSLRYHGILIFNMTNLQNPSLQNNFHTYGGEKCLLSYDENYIFVSDSFKGLTIINFQDKQKAFIQKNLNLGSQVQYGFQSLINPNILYLSLIENGQLAMIDITDKYNPFVLAKIQYGQERSIALREAPNQTFITYLTSNGLRIQSIKFSLKIHTQIRKINTLQYGQTKATYINLNPKDPVQVGQTIEFQFSSIQLDNDIKIQQVFYYRDYEINPIESWMTFFSSKNIFRMNVDKSALINSNGTNIILLQILKKIQTTSFIEPLYQITDTLSIQIFNKLKQKAVLQNENYLNLNNFFLDSNFYIELDNPSQYQNITQTQLFIKQIILESIYYQPIKFIVTSSLTLNINYIDEKVLQPIQTFSKTVKIIIQIQENISNNAEIQQNQVSSYFVENSIGRSATISLQQDFKQITIEGSTPDVNEVLYDGLQVVFNTDKNKIKFKVTIIDEINFEFIKTYNASELKFFKSTNSSNIINSLQEQYSDQISESLTVKNTYTFVFSQNTFQYKLPQKDNVDYSAFIKNDDDSYKNIDQIDWIDFDSSKRTFKWSGDLSQLSKKYTIVVNATTSSHWVKDEFEIYFERIPVEIIVMICLTSFTFVLIILLLYCYRSKIQHIRYFSRYTYSSEPAFVNKAFTKIIIIIPNYLGEFHKLWDHFIINEKKENNNPKINFKKFLNPQKEIEISLLLDKLKQIYESNKHFYSKLKEQEFKMTNTRLQFIIKGAFASLMIKEDLATYELYQQLKQIAKKKGFRKDWYKFYTKIIYPEKGSDKQVIPTIEESNSHSHIDSNQISQMDQNFPMIFIDENKIYFTLEEANSMSAQKNDAFNHYLLFEYIKAEAYGYTSKTIKRQESSYGETIHISPSNIKKIVAFRKNDNQSRFSCFPKLQNKYLFNFKEIQNLKNSNLPEWLKCDISQQAINFSGKPVSSDVGDILIRIYDNNNYILHQFFINVRKMRKLTYQNGDPELTQYIQQQQMMNMPNLIGMQSKMSKVFSMNGSGVIGGINNFGTLQSPNQLIATSPHPSSTQISQIQNSTHKRILRNHRNNTQKYSIKQYKQILNGIDINQRFKSENQIKDSSLTENYKKNSDEIVLNRTPQSPLQEDSLLQEKNVDTTNQDKMIMSYNNSSHQLQDNQIEIRIHGNEQVLSKQNSNFMTNKDYEFSMQGLLRNQQVLEEDVIHEEQYISQKDHKTASSLMYSKHNKNMVSIQLNETHSNSIQRNLHDNSELERSQGMMSQEVMFYLR